jgi:hypothetical protein
MGIGLWGLVVSQETSQTTLRRRDSAESDLASMKGGILADR